MKKDHDHIYHKAFDLRNAKRFPESIEELKRLRETGEDPEGICDFLIATLYYYELDDALLAVPFAKRAVELKPNSELASLCLVHCLFDLELHEEVTKEVRRYVATGGKIDCYQALFEENGVKAEDFT